MTEDNITRNLLMATYSGNLPALKILYLQERNIFFSHIKEALQNAVIKGHLECVKFIVDKEPTLHKTDETFLRYAVIEGHLDVVQFLSATGTNSQQAFTDAARNGRLDIAKFLFERGADIEAKNNEALRNAAKYNKLELVQFLIENGANIHAKNDEASKLAAQNGHLETLEYLISQNANMDVVNKYASKETQSWLQASELEENLPQHDRRNTKKKL